MRLIYLEDNRQLRRDTQNLNLGDIAVIIEPVCAVPPPAPPEQTAGHSAVSAKNRVKIERLLTKQPPKVFLMAMLFRLL
jgi:hypothetical protein